jgi:hypothetical protein
MLRQKKPLLRGEASAAGNRQHLTLRRRRGKENEEYIRWESQLSDYRG